MPSALILRATSAIASSRPSWSRKRSRSVDNRCPLLDDCLPTVNHVRCDDTNLRSRIDVVVAVAGGDLPAGQGLVEPLYLLAVSWEVPEVPDAEEHDPDRQQGGAHQQGEQRGEHSAHQHAAERQQLHPPHRPPVGLVLLGWDLAGVPLAAALRAAPDRAELDPFGAPAAAGDRELDLLHDLVLAD